jgi:hypothetical protein
MNTKIIEGVEYVTEEIEGKGICLVPVKKKFILENIHSGIKLEFNGGVYTVVGSNLLNKWGIINKECNFVSADYLFETIIYNKEELINRLNASDYKWELAK